MNLPLPPPQRHPSIRGLVAIVGAVSVARHGMHECGDIVRVLDRPDGGICAIIADGQGHGRAARLIAAMAVGRIKALVGEGAREDAALIAANDLLLAHRGGQVSCEAAIVSVDLIDGVIRVTRFARASCITIGDAGAAITGGEAPPLGIYRRAVPVVDTVEASASVACLVASDGVRAAGERTGHPLDLAAELARVATHGGDEAARAILSAAIAADEGRPRDDMSVACVTLAASTHGPLVRRIGAQWPLG